MVNKGFQELTLEESQNVNGGLIGCCLGALGFGIGAAALGVGAGVGVAALGVGAGVGMAGLGIGAGIGLAKGYSGGFGTSTITTSTTDVTPISYTYTSTGNASVSNTTFYSGSTSPISYISGTII
jgi:hypothetical protein